MSKPAEALQPVRDTSHPGAPTATLEEIDIRTALLSRGHRPVDHEREADALSVLAREMADNPRNMLQKLVETALDVCRADTAGLSLLEGDVFRWEAIAGVLAAHRNGTMPRDASPCGICTSQNSTQLMSLPDRCFPALRAEPRFVEALLIPFHNHGKAVGTVWIVAHTTERKFDGEDERFVRTLAQFASAGWQLWTAYESATSSSLRKDEFLAMLGHELRNPLAAIANGAAILEKLGTHPTIASAAGLVARQAKHSSRIVDDVLDVSRIGYGKLRLQNATVELGSVVVQALDTVCAQMDRRGHRVAVEMPAEPIYLDCDPDRIAQVLSNLLDNAAKHTPDGGNIWVSGALDGRNVRITVKDTGIGIPKERIDSVFDLFTQAGGRLDHGNSGLGLGLTLVRRLVEMHGGTVEAASAGPGLGSRFTIHLPASVARPQAATNGSPPAIVSPAASPASWTKAQ